MRTKGRGPTRLPLRGGRYRRRRRTRGARPQGGRLFGTFASGFAMLLVAAAGVLVWQMAGNRVSFDAAAPTPTRPR